MDLQSYLDERIALVEQALDRYLPDASTLPARLHEAMRYSIFAGGKRIRPVLTLAACEAVGAPPERALPVACALEMIHTYSLIHDDLPAMDDDDLRRGRPTNHKVFGEATAILAGDALLTQAFVLLTDPDFCSGLPPATRVRIIHLIACCSGSMGMVGGQVVDMDSEGRTVDFPVLEYIHTHKTGALILASVQAGGLVGAADDSAMQSLSGYAGAAGLAFQIADDILDVVGESAALGKGVGGDQARGKITYPALLGLNEARARARELKERAIEFLAPLGAPAEPLREIARYIVDRGC